MRWVRIIIHCTATKAGRECSVAEIDRWHRQRGFKSIGYHFVIHPDGSVQEGRPLTQPGAHCYGYNKSSIGICYVGGLDENSLPRDTRTEAQKTAMHELVNNLKQLFDIKTVMGHNEVAEKACPCFNVKNEFP